MKIKKSFGLVITTQFEVIKELQKKNYKKRTNKMTSIHTINNNLRTNAWQYNPDLGVWTNKSGYKINYTGKIFHDGQEIYFPIARELADDPEGRALRFEYTGDGTAACVKSNAWHNFDAQYCHRQKHLTRRRREKARRRRKECKENEYQLEKENARKAGADEN